MSIATESFRSLVCAEPARVWDELTATGRPLDWLYGLVVKSTWQSGASIAVGVGVDQQWAVIGEVLTADRPHRLSFTLGHTLADAAVFVTWELAPDRDRTIVRLTVDETEAHCDASRGMELAWLPVIQTLTTLLADQATTPERRPKTA
jgi:uncharacterized protein YndB with AHSA1/START domain